MALPEKLGTSDSTHNQNIFFYEPWLTIFMLNISHPGDVILKLFLKID